VDVGVAADLPEAPGLIRRKIAYGTANLIEGPAMTPEQAEAAVQVGLDVVARSVKPVWMWWRPATWASATPRHHPPS